MSRSSVGGQCGKKPMETCCTCSAREEPPPTIPPIELQKRCGRGDCYFQLACPDGLELSRPVGLCGGAKCSLVGEAYTASLLVRRSWACRRENGGDESYTECQTCVPVATTPPPKPVAWDPNDGRVWEVVGGEGSRACRGRTPEDNSPTYYEVINETADLEVCQQLCLERFPHCHGVEFSRERCELWERDQGIASWTDPGRPHMDFVCMRFGWPTENLVPKDGGVDRACRGDDPEDNSEAYYTLSSALNVEDCKAQCSAAPVCFGVEFGFGRCEVRTRPVRATANVTGFECHVMEHAGRTLTVLP
mmetsp:Transcript_63472/g.177624  ORF Transcript_63472/g.177624 Transcript_63472/m.177624 type:complete len:305 (-) Transcript_63472:69-983(-)